MFLCSKVYFLFFKCFHVQNFKVNMFIIFVLFYSLYIWGGIILFICFEKKVFMCKTLKCGFWVGLLNVLNNVFFSYFSMVFDIFAHNCAKVFKQCL